MMAPILVGLIALIIMFSVSRPGRRVRNRRGRRRFGPQRNEIIARAADGSIEGDDGNYGIDVSSYGDYGGCDYGGGGDCGGGGDGGGD